MNQPALADEPDRPGTDVAVEATLSERLDLITRLARRLFRAPIVLISLLEQNSLCLAACQGLPISALGRELGIDRRTLANGGPLIVADTQADPRFNSHPFVTGRPHIRFYAGCLLLGADGAVAGVLSVCDREPDALAEGDLIQLRDLARLVETELRVAGLNERHAALAAERERMRRNALLDTATNMWNRHAMFELLDREFHRARREREYVAVILVEIDDYGAIADRHGEAGARVLLNVTAGVIREHVRRSDAVARFGSAAQFLVFLGRCHVEAAVLLAERMQHRTRNEAVELNGTQVPINMSIGVAGGKPDGDWTPDGLVRNAEEALRAARSMTNGPRVAIR
ncbi:MAG TPA: sensor domain-containing diguanylate cyclase [Burkholderiales bacterium]|jgi:diguanylate cyclase (GGDEF) domain